MNGILEKNASEVGKFQDFILRVAQALKHLFAASEGWEKKAGRKGLDFMSWNKSSSMISIRKSGWKESALIMIAVFLGYSWP